MPVRIHTYRVELQPCYNSAAPSMAHIIPTVILHYGKLTFFYPGLSMVSRRMKENSITSPFNNNSPMPFINILLTVIIMLVINNMDNIENKGVIEWGGQR